MQEIFSASKKGTHIPDSGTLRFDSNWRTKAAITANKTMLTATEDKGGDLRGMNQNEDEPDLN